MGGFWASYTHEDVRQWLWEATTVPAVSIRLWKRQVDATKQSAFVGYATEEQARTALRILQHNPYMWGERVTVTWGRDNPAAAVPQPVVPSEPAGGGAVRGSKDVGVQAGPSYLSFVDKEVGGGEEDEFPSPSQAPPSEATLDIPPTEPANSPTLEPPTSPQSSEAPTAEGNLTKETEEAVERVKRAKVKQEVKEEQGD